ncbi:MAG: carboxypeptidase-like regulatory domain-containing protein, partial [Bacteroidota bacterium]
MKRLIMFSLPLLAFVLAFSPVTGFKVKGKIMDQQGNAISGVAVTIKGTTSGTTSGADGTYSIEAPDQNRVLVFSSIGYVTVQESISGRAIIDVVLVASKQMLQEVVVTGYGVARKKSITSSVARVDANKNALPYTTNALDGKVSGLQIQADGNYDKDDYEEV